MTCGTLDSAQPKPAVMFVEFLLNEGLGPITGHCFPPFLAAAATNYEWAVLHTSNIQTL